MENALMVKRKRRAVIGSMVTLYFCESCKLPNYRGHATEVETLRRGDDAGLPFVCHRCGRELGGEHDELAEDRAA